MPSSDELGESLAPLTGGVEETGEGSDMEGWEDDGWGTFDASLGDDSQKKTNPSLSSGADFFDTYQSGTSSSGVMESKNDDFFSNFGPTATFSTKERSPPPPVSSSYFGEKETESKNEGWGDWEDDFSTPVQQVQV